ncbi:MAG: 4'-phosphopantetheinyl transferase superfamily protein [Gemmatimonas sp.]
MAHQSDRVMHPLAARGDGALARELAATVRGVRVWFASLDALASEDDRFVCLLSSAERARADGLRASQGVRFRRARGLLRLLLAEVTGEAPEHLAIQYNADGKPALAAHAAPQFSLSYARGVVLLAIGDERRVGVDVEWTNGEQRYTHIAARFFSVAERAAVDREASERARTMFARIWVRKEAYLKGRGEGISQWIHRTDFSQQSPETEEPREAQGVARDQDLWRVRDIADAPAGYVAALAVENSVARC